MFEKSRSMGFVIQIVAGKASIRPRTEACSAVVGNVARRDLGAKTAARDFLNTAWADLGTGSAAYLRGGPLAVSDRGTQ